MVHVHKHVDKQCRICRMPGRSKARRPFSSGHYDEGRMYAITYPRLETRLTLIITVRYGQL